MSQKSALRSAHLLELLDGLEVSIADERLFMGRTPFKTDGTLPAKSQRRLEMADMTGFAIDDSSGTLYFHGQALARDTRYKPDGFDPRISFNVKDFFNELRVDKATGLKLAFNGRVLAYASAQAADKPKPQKAAARTKTQKPAA